VRRASLAIPLLGLLLVLAGFAAATVGAAGISVERLLAAMGAIDGDAGLLARDRLVLWSVRAPRILMAVSIGALLAVAGTIMQGLFRNPLADPGLVGVSAGGALAAAGTIVLGDRLMAHYAITLPFQLLPLAAFVGSLIATAILYRIATREGRTSIATFLLAGLAIGALAMAGVGLLVFLADDRQLRDIQFWMLGSLGGATWDKALLLAAVAGSMLLAIPWIARGLDLLVLGEAEAFHMGVEVERLKRAAIVLVAAASGAAVAFAGVIGFVGIVVPHLLRLALGPGHRVLLPASLCFGAILLLAADTVARVLVAPAELPIGIVTATLGAPFFLALLMRQRALVAP
jgi:iron complex transport system permease protein